jgi:hypothetical protein
MGVFSSVLSRSYKGGKKIGGHLYSGSKKAIKKGRRYSKKVMAERKKKRNRSHME